MQPQKIQPMSSKQRHLGALLVAVALVAGCRSERPLDTASMADAAPVTVPPGTPARADRTAMQAAADQSADSAASAGATVTALASPATSSALLAPNAPDSYVVKRGDTLWGIAQVFLRDPWHWPEIWQENPHIRNPHLIYPGDTLRLIYVGGRPQLMLQRAERSSGAAQRGIDVRVLPRVRSEPLQAAVTTIPYATVAAFMSKPSVLSREQIRGAPYLVASLNDHAAIAAGNTVYAMGFAHPPEIGTSYNIVRVGDALHDPGSRKILGYDGILTGTARVTRSGSPATLVLTESNRESEPGDKVIAAEADVPLDFIPSAPKSKIDGRIIAVTDGATVIGQYEVVVIDRGARDGLVAGNVLAVYKTGEVVRDNEKHGYLSGSRTVFSRKVRLPDEPTGTFMVFKAFDRISYGLIMEAQNIISVQDKVESPQ